MRSMRQVRQTKHNTLIVVAVMFIFTHLLSSQAVAGVFAEKDVYTKTLNRWNDSVSHHGLKSNSWVWNLKFKDTKHKNLSRDSILIVPNSSIPDDLTLVVWFHGCGGFGLKTFKNRIIPQIKKISRDGHSIAVAIPEMPWSTNTSTKCSRQGQVWQAQNELENYVKEVKVRLGIWSKKYHGVELEMIRIVFVGHSAGGSAIASAAKEGSLCLLDPENVIWSDASYGNWLDKAWHGCIKNDSDIKLTILVKKWNTPWKRASAFFRRVKKSNKRIFKILSGKNWTHTKIGHNALELSDIFPPGC